MSPFLAARQFAPGGKVAPLFNAPGEQGLNTEMLGGHAGSTTVPDHVLVVGWLCTGFSSFG